ncbi:uncharacterized protein LOC111715260 [Eurytemora carolleeae]|uniref:uncharacterized protein LOC111715260 n=1 Tax=Eurytemora carolleeae TaxID=1294199 RepID=UPI000C76C23D|nr:uncharacterized protein LOC111715260 [Eurytemora carolleeae]|eukprot:XP_023346333.1 uncharacterized protein LOC111715260 [Eurytemora affinis]
MINKKLLNNVEAHSGRITGLCALNLNILTSGWDSNINIWSKGLVRLSQIFLNYVPINCICLHPFKNSVVVGSWDKSIRIFDIDSKEQKAKLTGASSIQKIALSEDATKIAAGTLCGKVELWDGRKGVKISSLNTGSSITALEFSSQARLLIGDSTGKITGVNYNEGSRVTAPEYPFQLPMYSSFSEQYNTQNIQEQTSLKRNISALTVAAHETFILGFDNGDVMFYQQEESSECYKGFGWHFADEPIAEIGHRLDFALEISDWSLLDDQELGAFFVRSRSSVSVHSLRSRVCLYLEGIESEIVGVLLTEIKFDPHILVILESEILVYPAVQFGLSNRNMFNNVLPLNLCFSW